MTRFFTIGHSNRSLHEFIALLAAHDIGVLVDVRKLAGSNKYPHFNADTLREQLAQEGIGFKSAPALAGRRPVNKQVPFETNAWWENRSFHNYADHALSEEFGAGLEELLVVGAAANVAVMCSEAVWWRCHRRIVTDYLLAHDVAVFHILGPGQGQHAELSAGAVLGEDHLVRYPAR